MACLSTAARRRNLRHKSCKYHSVKQSELSTLWAACRAVLFGSIVITVGILMTVLGYFDVNLSQEVVRTTGTGVEEISINWTKRYFVKSLQYLGPFVMGIGSFILIIACVVTLEDRDKNIQVLHNVKDSEPLYGKNKPQWQAGTMGKHLPITEEEIRDWTPRYIAVPLAGYDSSPMLNRRRRSAPCIPQTLLDTTDIRRLYERFLDCYHHGRMLYTENDAVPEAHEHGRACTSTSECHGRPPTPRHNVIVEVHSPPITLLLNTMPPSSPSSQRGQQHQSYPDPDLVSSSTASLLKTSEFAYIENNYSNFIVAFDPPVNSISVTNIVDATTTVAAVSDVRPVEASKCALAEESERRAPLASLDIEFHSSSSSSAF